MGLVESGKIPKPVSSLLNMSRKYSMWVYQWGLACCAIEMGAAFASPRYDVMRLGVIPLPASPRQADLVVISGTVTDKMVPSVKRLYEQRAAMVASGKAIDWAVADGADVCDPVRPARPSDRTPRGVLLEDVCDEADR